MNSMFGAMGMMGGGGLGSGGKSDPNAGLRPQMGKRPSGYKQVQQTNFNPMQMDLFRQMFGQVSPESQLGQLAGGDEEMFQQMEAPAQRQFAQSLGQLGSRFSGMGQTGSQQSSGFRNVGGQLGSDFAQDLAARRQGLQRQAMMDLHNMSNQLLGQRPYSTNYIPKQPKGPSGFQKLLGGALPIAGAALGSFGGPMGASIGGQLGGMAGSAFSGQGGGGGMDWGSIANLPTSWGNSNPSVNQYGSISSGGVSPF